MEWTLLSPSSSRSEVNFPSLCEVKDEHSHLFPSKPIPGMMEHFQPLLITLDKCMGTHPVALVEEVEEMLKKDYPNAIPDQKLISFTEYVLLARLRGIPIRCDQAFGKPKYMWFNHNKESWFNNSTTDQAVNVDVKDTKTLIQPTDIEDQPEHNFKHDDVKEENFDIPEIVIPARTGNTRSGQEGDIESNRPDIKSKWIIEDLISEQNRIERILMGNIRHYTLQEFFKLKLNCAHYFNFISDFWRNDNKGRRMMQNNEKLQVYNIIVSMIKNNHAFCRDSLLLKLVEVIVTIIVRKLHHRSIITYSLLRLSILETFPELLGSPLDRKSKMDAKFRSLLSRLRVEGLDLSITCVQNLARPKEIEYEIDISDALELVCTNTP